MAIGRAMSSSISRTTASEQSRRTGLGPCPDIHYHNKLTNMTINDKFIQSQILSSLLYFHTQTSLLAELCLLSMVQHLP